jgi:hypothetical protein
MPWRNRLTGGCIFELQPFRGRQRLTFRRPRGHTRPVKVNRRLARKLYRRVINTGKYDDWRIRADFDVEWLPVIEIMAEDLRLYPGHRATIRDWDDEIELHWRRSSKDGLPYITSVSLVAPPGQALNPERLHEIRVPYIWAALVLRLAAQPESPPEAPRPETGKAPSLAHYRKVLAEYDELVREGHSSPVSVLADRYGARPGTVKAWLHRGRKYLKDAT